MAQQHQSNSRPIRLVIVLFLSLMISFVVPLFNHLDQTEKMVKTLLSSMVKNFDFEVLVIDDGSTDGTVEWLHELPTPCIKKIFNSNNIGYARSNNRAASMAQGEVLALLNNDLLLEPGWLTPMLDLLYAPLLNAGLVGNLQFRVDGPELDHAGVEISCDGTLGHVRALPKPALSHGHPQAFAVTGACCVIRKSDFDAVGGFDEGFINGGEDIDLCLRIQALGKKVYVAADSQVRHHVSLSRGRTSIQNEHNSRRLQHKWRREFKNEIASRWATLLQRPSSACAAEGLDGHLTDIALTSPSGIARLLADAALCRQEARWQRELDQCDANDDLPSRCTVLHAGFLAGLPISRGGSPPQWGLEVKGLHSAKNFFICGRRVLGSLARPLRLTVRINDLQEKVFDLGDELDFNFGVLNPLVLPGFNNRFTVSIDFALPGNMQRRGDASSQIVMTHFVLDDHLVPCAAR